MMTAANHKLPMLRNILLLSLSLFVTVAAADDKGIPLWPDEVPGPRVEAEGAEVDLPSRGGAPIRRTTNITKPSLVAFPAMEPSGTAVIVIPGGGFGYLTTDLEGSEACEWLQKLGVTAFLLKHRAPTNKQPEPNAGPVIDAQQAVRIVRSRAAEWKVKPNQIGVLGFSAGGQVALVAATNASQTASDEAKLHRPDFLLLCYPWGLYQPAKKALRPDVKVDASTPPTFISQAADDKSSLPQGSTLLYLALLDHQVPAELHIYETGGHGYGLRPAASPCPTDWPKRAEDWLRKRKLIP
jgi:acetyl esterase/lipase